MTSMICFIQLSISLMTNNPIEGHWVRVTAGEVSCSEELIFDKKDDFKILQDCFDGNQLSEVANGQYLVDGKKILFGFSGFSSAVSDFYTREYTRMEWKLSGDTLKIVAFRFECEERVFVRY